MITKSILKNTYHNTYIETGNKSKDTLKTTENALFIDDETTHISCKSVKNIDNQHERSHLKSTELSNRKSQTKSEACSDNFDNSISSENELDYVSKALTNEYGYEPTIENSDSFTDLENKPEKIELEQDIREIDRIINQHRLLSRNAFKKPKPRSTPIDPKDVTAMWKKIEETFTYENIFYYQNEQKVYLKDISPSEVVRVLYEMAGSDAKRKEEVSDLRLEKRFASLMQEGYEKSEDLEVKKGNFESTVLALLSPCRYFTDKTAVKTAILAEAVAILLRDTFTEFGKLTDDDIADAVIAAFLCKSKSNWLDGTNLCCNSNSENYVKKILKSTSLDLHGQRCTRIANAIDHRNDPLFDSDGSIKKDLLAIILQITSHLCHRGQNVKLFDFTSKDYKIDHPSFNFSSSLSSEEVHARIITFLERTDQFIGMDIYNLAKEVLSDLEGNSNYNCPLGRSLYEIYRNSLANNTHLFEVKRPYFKYSSQPCDDTPSRGKMRNVTPKRIFKFLNGKKRSIRVKFFAETIKLIKNKDRNPKESKKLKSMNKKLPTFMGEKFSELFKCENVFEIAESFLKLSPKIIAKLLIRKGFSSSDFKHMISIAESCLELKNNGWSEKFAQRVTFYRIRLLEAKVFMKGHRGGRGVCECQFDADSSSEKEIQKSLLQYSKVKIGNQVTISHTRNFTYKFAKFVSSHGGIYPLIELLMEFHSISSWCTIPVIVKAWLLHQRENPDAHWGAYLNEKPATTDTNSAFFNFTDGTLLGNKEGVEEYLKIISNQDGSFYDKMVIQTLAFRRCQDFLYYEQDIIYQADDSVKKILNSKSIEDCPTQLKSIRNNLDNMISNIEKQLEQCSNSTSELLRMVPIYLGSDVVEALKEVTSDIEVAIGLSQEELGNTLPRISQKLSNVKESFDVAIKSMFENILVGRRDDIQLTDLLKTEAVKNTVPNERNVRMFNETLYMFYAFVQNAIYLTPDFPKEFYRSFDNKAFENYFGYASKQNTKSTTEKLKNTATYDAYHIIKLSQFGDSAVKISPDPWRIFMPYPLLCSLIPSWRADYNEFDIMAGDCDATILENDPDEDSDEEFEMHNFPQFHNNQSHGNCSDCDSCSTYSERSDSEVQQA